MTAWESMTLPSRLRSSLNARETLDQLENTLNINGNQNIAKLQMSIPQQNITNGSTNGTNSGANNDVRMATNGHAAEEQKPIDDESESSYDLDFFSIDLGDYSRGRRSSSQNHVFGQARNSRGMEVEDQNQTNRSTDLGQERARRRAAGLKITRRYILLFRGYIYASNFPPAHFT